MIVLHAAWFAQYNLTVVKPCSQSCMRLLFITSGRFVPLVRQIYLLYIRFSVLIYCRILFNDRILKYESTRFSMDVTVSQ